MDLLKDVLQRCCASVFTNLHSTEVDETSESVKRVIIRNDEKE